jgi:hypothetical protein
MLTALCSMCIPPSCATATASGAIFAPCPNSGGTATGIHLAAIARGAIGGFPNFYIPRPSMPSACLSGCRQRSRDGPPRAADKAGQSGRTDRPAELVLYASHARREALLEPDIEPHQDSGKGKAAHAGRVEDAQRQRVFHLQRSGSPREGNQSNAKHSLVARCR